MSSLHSHGVQFLKRGHAGISSLSVRLRWPRLGGGISIEAEVPLHWPLIFKKPLHGKKKIVHDLVEHYPKRIMSAWALFVRDKVNIMQLLLMSHTVK